MALSGRAKEFADMMGVDQSTPTPPTSNPLLPTSTTQTPTATPVPASPQGAPSFWDIFNKNKKTTTPAKPTSTPTKPTTPLPLKDPASPTGKNPKSTVSTTQAKLSTGQTAEEYNRSNITNPKLPPSSLTQVTNQKANKNELLNKGDYMWQPQTMAQAKDAQLRWASLPAPNTTSMAQSPQAKQAAQYLASLVDPSLAGQVMQAAQGQLSPQSIMDAAQGKLNPEISKLLSSMTNFDPSKLDPRATVQGQYEQLTNFDASNPPAWAKGAIATANAQMAARGMGSSTMAAGATTGAILQAAMPIAQQDAAVFAGIHMKQMDMKQQATFLQAGYLADMDMKNLDNRQQAAVVNAQNFMQMDLANLSNRQQASLINAQSRAQALFSNQSAQNAQKQFNATSQNQVNQFYDQLSAQVSMYNSGQQNAMKQFNSTMYSNTSMFNTGQANQMSMYNSGQRNSMSQFNASLEAQRRQFNSNMGMQIDQGNAQWLRQINTNNTSMQNQANMINAQRMFDTSSTAMANELQDIRDRLYYSFTSQENAFSRAQNLAIAQMQNDAYFKSLDKQQQASFWNSIGNVAGTLLGSLFGD